MSCRECWRVIAQRCIANIDASICKLQLCVMLPQVSDKANKHDSGF